MFNLLETEGITFLLNSNEWKLWYKRGFYFNFCELRCGDHPQEDLSHNFCELRCGDHPQEDLSHTRGLKPNLTTGWKGH